MEQIFIQLTTSGQSVYVDSSKIVYIIVASDPRSNAVIFFAEKFGLSVSETPEEILELIETKKAK